jgi:Ima1 N-terminal domain
MSRLLRRKTRIVCFFCQTTISPPPLQPLSFLCPHCTCWNRYDLNGDILSDDPAMHDETLNRKSFARRGASCLSSCLSSLSLTTESVSQHPHGRTASSPLLAMHLSAPHANPTRGSSSASCRVIFHPQMTCATSSTCSLVQVCSFLLTTAWCCHRIPIMHLASRALQPTKRPSTHATHLSAIDVHRLSKRRFGRRMLWHARTRSGPGSMRARRKTLGGRSTCRTWTDTS